jgi:hypothetical protein
MSENPEPDTGSLRVGDREREDAVRLLDGHFSAGRLTGDEHTERTTAAYAARTRHDLDVLFTDLPGGRRAGPTGDDTAAEQESQSSSSAAADAANCRHALPGWVPLLAAIAVVCGLGAARGWPAGFVPLIIVAAVLLARRGGCCRRR